MICESPLHAGSGSDLDFIDNPIQRERHTGYPKIESSSLKGAIRERFAEQLDRDHPDIAVAFGPNNPSSGNERQGSLGFSDARLLLFPVKSAKGVFAWITCNKVLQRFREDFRRTDNNQDFDIEPFLPVNSNEAFVFSDALVMKDEESEQHIILEEYDFDARQDAEISIEGTPIQNWLAETLFPAADFEFWNKELSKKLVILHDDDFADFVELTTEVITRNKINPETGTVQKGHLFSEEYLPVDSILYSLVMSHAEFHKNGSGKKADEVLKFFTSNLSGQLNNTLQVGGNATIGKGLIRTVLAGVSS